MSFACIRGMFSAIGQPEVDADQIGKKLPNLPRLMQIPDAAVNVDVEQNGCWLVK
jgi:hypothetical protein